MNGTRRSFLSVPLVLPAHVLAFAAPAQSARIVDVRRIWDQATHNAFTDLIRFHSTWFCVFREGTAHVSPDGTVRVLTSNDGLAWRSATLVSLPGRDLRDPKLSTTPEGRMMLIAAGVVREPQNSLQTFAWFSRDGAHWGEAVAIGEPDLWLWRASWYKGAAYGIGYGRRDGKDITRLYRSRDGVHYETLVPVLFTGGYPNESSIVFRPDGAAVCLLRRDKGTATAQFGTASAPYADWTWKDLGVRVGGPHLLEVGGGRIVAGVRLHDGKVRTALCSLDPENGRIEELASLPSSGDSSYPGLVWHNGRVWMSYYSSHEGRTSIYLARLEL